jgi:TRAP-type C4-dicarboxylate transport system substrate-binding protein
MLKKTLTLMALCASLPALAQVPASLPAGPKVTIAAVTQPVPTQPQYTRVDQPILRDLVRQRSGGRIEVTLSTHAERNLAGNEIVRLVRSGQVEIGAGTLSTLSGDVPILDGIDLAGLAPDITNARRIADDIVSPMLADAQDRVHFADAVLQARLAAVADPEGKRLDAMIASFKKAAARVAA